MDHSPEQSGTSQTKKILRLYLRDDTTKSKNKKQPASQQRQTFMNNRLAEKMGHKHH